MFSEILSPLLDIVLNYYAVNTGWSFMLILYGAGAILGAALILNRRAYGLWIMFAAVLIRTISIFSRLKRDVFQMSDAEINRLGLILILSFAPVLLTWLFTRGRVHYGFGNKGAAVVSRRITVPVGLQRPPAPAPESGAGRSMAAYTPAEPTPGPADPSGPAQTSEENAKSAAKPEGDVLPAFTADMFDFKLVPVSAAPRSGPGMSSFQAAIQLINKDDGPGAIQLFMKALHEGLNELHAGYTYSEMGVIELMERGNANQAIGYWLAALLMRQVFYETAHTACQYLIIVYDLAGAHAQVKILSDLLARTAGYITYSLSPEAKVQIRKKLDAFTWRLE